MIWLLVLAWVFAGLLAIGLWRKNKRRKIELGKAVCFILYSPMALAVTVSEFLENSDFWNKKI